MAPYGDTNLGHYWLRQWLAWRHQAITGTNVHVSSKMSSDIHRRAIKNVLMNLISDVCSVIILLKLLPQPPRKVSQLDIRWGPRIETSKCSKGGTFAFWYSNIQYFKQDIWGWGWGVKLVTECVATTMTACLTMALGECGSDFKSVISEFMLRINFISTCCEHAFRRLTQNTFDDSSTFLQVMTWFRHQAITWANVDNDTCRQMASIANSEITHWGRNQMTTLNIFQTVHVPMPYSMSLTSHPATLFWRGLTDNNSSPLVPHICVCESGQHWFK